MKNLYWPVYLNLERELLDVARTIHINDRQLEVYSMRIADLLVRTVVEIEAISKELFYANGGTIPEGQDYPYFDSDCIRLLADKWKIDKKIVLVTAVDMFMEEDSNVVLRPLCRARWRGNKGQDWNRAYQNVKHNRMKMLHKGTLKIFIRALAALYLLNIYYRDENVVLDHDCTGRSHDFSFGSSVFSIQCHGKGSVISHDGGYVKGDDYEECVYLSVPNQEKYKQAVALIRKDEDDALLWAVKQFEAEVQTHSDSLKYFNEHATQRIGELKSQRFIELRNKNARELGLLMMNMNYDGVLNKNQF